MEQRVSGEYENRESTMSDRRKNTPSHDGRPTRLASGDRNRETEFAAQADVMLARYPADVREQIADLLRVLAAKPGEAENGIR
jgi:hypothetical protein